MASGLMPVNAPTVLHLLLAVGALPLILSAMIYFAPVLTRSSVPSGWLHGVPLLALLSGLLVVAALWQWFWLLAVAVPLALLAVVALYVWMRQQARRALGGPHPGLRWYQDALLLLLLALALISLLLFWPEQWSIWRTLHRHLNLCGFVGLTAIGTLQVLLPTVGSYPDAKAGQRLRLDRRYALLATLALVAGSLVGPLLSAVGVALWGWLLLRLLQPWLPHWRRTLQADGAALLLVAAVIGFACAVSSTLWQEGQIALPLFIALFLLPLLSGALAHLLPLWWWPGVPTARRDRAQRLLAKGAAWRLLCCWAAAAALSAELGWGLLLLAIPPLWLLGSTLFVLLTAEP